MEKLETNFKGHFPWASFLLTFVVVYIFACNLSLVLPYAREIKNMIAHPTHLSGLLVALLLTFIFDILLFFRCHKRLNDQIRNLSQKITLTREQKKKQQLRANTVSDHSDKLKSFISDKLIEYMDFDEKFMHFKGIAAEVRHNGIISYDKINVALNKAIEQQNYLAIYERNNELNDQENNNKNNSMLYDYQRAKDSIAYLWDLLDLSTAENMALYIGKKIIDYEEMYYQTQLNPSEHGDLSQSLGINPTFYPIQSLLMTMALFCENEDIRHLLTDSKINESLLTAPFRFEDQQFILLLDPTPAILGNPNHLVLLLENLIKNAQFFNGKSRYKQNSDRIIIKSSQKLKTYEGEEEALANICIYNRGNHIDDDDIENIFKLGYTTRKKSDVNGRGLGLYFVNEIVKGYQGTINAVNITNQDIEYQLTLELASKELFEFTIFAKEIKGRLLVSMPENKALRELNIEKDIPIESIRLSAGGEMLFSVDEIEPDRDYRWQDESFLPAPVWSLSLSVFKKRHQLIFRALDISGVQFDIFLPLVDE